MGVRIPGWTKGDPSMTACNLAMVGLRAVPAAATEEECLSGSEAAAPPEPERAAAAVVAAAKRYVADATELETRAAARRIRHAIDCMTGDERMDGVRMASPVHGERVIPVRFFSLRPK